MPMRQSLESLVLTEDEREFAREAIREKAHTKWQEAGCPEGDALNFWLEAESEWIEYCYVPYRYPVCAAR